MQSKKIVILTSHVFLQGFRKASIHFVARNWASTGNTVFFTTVGHSFFSRFMRPGRFGALKREQYNRYVEVEPGLHAGAHLPFMHAFSSKNAFVNALAGPLFRVYGRFLPPFVAERIREADLVVIESGTPLAFVALARKLNPNARLLYFCRDLLKSIGAAPFLQDLERRHIGDFTRICVPSRRLGETLPRGGCIAFIPQGIERSVFDRADTSPYDAGSRNAVAVGDMLFDREAVIRMAEAAPEVTFHLFGVKWQGGSPRNIRVHGEKSFESLAPYIRHADMGLAPYRLGGGEAYLAESSLKLLQYSYCLLPIVLPEGIPVSRGNEVTYRQDGETQWRAVIDCALNAPRPQTLRDGILSWEEVSQKTLESVFSEESPR